MFVPAAALSHVCELPEYARVFAGHLQLILADSCNQQRNFQLDAATVLLTNRIYATDC
jgi:hypothetical protein